jgi:beta-galactosidase
MAGISPSATLTIASPKDLYIDMSAWGSGYVFVNGRNLGGYWTKAGPQKRLYCPGVWLVAGSNTLVVFELTQESAGSLAFFGGSGLPLNITNPVSTAAVPPLTVGASYFLQNVNSGLYLDAMPPVAGSSNGYPGQASFSGAASQGWRADADASGGMTFTNLGSGTVLDVAAHKRSAGSSVILYAANGGANQSWTAAGVSQGVYTLTGRESQLLLDVSEQSKSATSLSASPPVAAIVIQDPAGNARWPFSQQWRAIPAVLDQGIYTLTIAAANLLLGTYQSATAQGSRLAIAAATGGAEQQWQMLAAGDGSWRLKNVKSGLLMDVTSSGTTNSSPLEIWPDNGGANQRFVLVPRPDGKSFALEGVQSRRVVDANGSGTSPTSYGSTNVSALTLWDDNGGANQSWIFSKIG